MIHKKTVLVSLIILCSGLYTVSAQSRPASPQEFLEIGLSLYGEARYIESVAVLRCILSEDPLYPDALYWISTAEITLRKYNEALADLEALAKIRSRWSTEIPYNRGRCYFYLGEYEKALVNFGGYIESLEENDLRRAVSFYWMGESLFAMGRLDSAANAYSLVIDKFPYSVKYEASCYRMELISQKKVEAELLALLKWSHEESIRSLEDYRARERIYEQAIASYKREIAELRGDPSGAGPDSYQGRFEAEVRIAALEASLAEANAALERLRGEVPAVNVPWQPPPSNGDKDARAQGLLDEARELFNTLNRNLYGE
ncbi:MAG: tetratricopeptide repeat protein [Spirochaetaceae bacterium]|jgi:tetratricopeptide (TPR) repeat protein|nr:tetratricopeptide repeat protein [Spirochaetaceae bacterium]